MNCHSWEGSRWRIETHCWLFFIYLYLFAPYLSKPLTGVQTPGSTFPQQLIMLLFSLLLMGKAFCAALRLIWSSFPLPFNFPNYLRVLYPYKQHSSQIRCSGMKPEHLLAPKNEFCSLSPDMNSLLMKAFASEKMSVFYFSQLKVQPVYSRELHGGIF